MAKFCASCGKEINEGSGFCASCGTSLSGQVTQKKGKGIASAILGILALLYAVFGLVVHSEIVEETIAEGTITNNAEAFGFALGVALVQLVVALIAFFLAKSERKGFKNGFNTTGFWTSVVTFGLAAVTFILVFMGLN